MLSKHGQLLPPNLNTSWYIITNLVLYHVVFGEILLPSAVESYWFLSRNLLALEKYHILFHIQPTVGDITTRLAVSGKKLNERMFFSTHWFKVRFAASYVKKAAELTTVLDQSIKLITHFSTLSGIQPDIAAPNQTWEQNSMQRRIVDLYRRTVDSAVRRQL